MNALKYLKEFFEMRKQLFQGNHQNVSNELNDLGINDQNFDDNQIYLNNVLDLERQIFQQDHLSEVSHSKIGDQKNNREVNKDIIYKNQSLEILEIPKEGQLKHFEYHESCHEIKHSILLENKNNNNQMIEMTQLDSEFKSKIMDDSSESKKSIINNLKSLLLFEQEQNFILSIEEDLQDELIKNQIIIDYKINSKQEQGQVVQDSSISNFLYKNDIHHSRDTTNSFQNDNDSSKVEQNNYFEINVEHNFLDNQNFQDQEQQQYKSDIIQSGSGQESSSFNQSLSLTKKQLHSPEICDKHDLCFELLLQNPNLSSNFLELKDSIIKILKIFPFFMEFYNYSDNNIDYFEGEYYSQTIIFKIYYNIRKEDIEKEIKIMNELQEQEKTIIRIATLKFSKVNFLVVLYKQSYLSNEKALQAQLLKEEFNPKMFDQQIQQIKKEEVKKKIETSLKEIKDKLKENKYTLREYIGEGREGVVFRGYKQIKVGQFQERVFKIMLSISDEEIKEEIRILNILEKNNNTINQIEIIKITHGYIQVLQSCQYDLFSELQLILQTKEFTQSKLFKMIFDLLDGLIQLKIYNILHLDIKPQNILLSLSGVSSQYIYTDFGVSCIQRNNEQVQYKGHTPGFASNEQEQEVTDKINYLSDVYSLGCTFMVVIKAYKCVYYEDNISELENIINQFMIQEKQEDRKDCLQLLQIFLDYFLKKDYRQNIIDYLKSIPNLQNDYENINIQFLQECLHHYLNINQDLQQCLNIAEYEIEEQLNSIIYTLPQI